MAIPERVMGAGHRGVAQRVVEQGEDFGNDAVLVGADQPRGAGRDALRTLGGLAHHEDWLAERRCLLLHTARIGQDYVRHA